MDYQNAVIGDGTTTNFDTEWIEAEKYRQAIRGRVPGQFLVLGFDPRMITNPEVKKPVIHSVMDLNDIQAGNHRVNFPAKPAYYIRSIQIAETPQGNETLIIVETTTKDARFLKHPTVKQVIDDITAMLKNSGFATVDFMVPPVDILRSSLSGAGIMSRTTGIATWVKKTNGEFYRINLAQHIALPKRHQNEPAWNCNEVAPSTRIVLSMDNKLIGMVMAKGNVLYYIPAKFLVEGYDYAASFGKVALTNPAEIQFREGTVTKVYELSETEAISLLSRAKNGTLKLTTFTGVIDLDIQNISRGQVNVLGYEAGAVLYVGPLHVRNKEDLCALYRYGVNGSCELILTKAKPAFSKQVPTRLQATKATTTVKDNKTVAKA